MLAPCEENQAYVYALSHGLARVAAQRLGALSLLLSLLEQADISPSDIVLHRDENGRPFALDGMDSRRFDFNLTHTDSVVGCVLWTGVGRVGMDIEHAPDADRVKKIADRYFSDGERSMMTDEDSSHAFLRIWTAKEALFKVTGKGPLLALSRLALPQNVALRYTEMNGCAVTVALSL